MPRAGKSSRDERQQKARSVRLGGGRGETEALASDLSTCVHRDRRAHICLRRAAALLDQLEQIALGVEPDPTERVLHLSLVNVADAM